jgi:hypothetical protein
MSGPSAIQAVGSAGSTKVFGDGPYLWLPSTRPDKNNVAVRCHGHGMHGNYLWAARRPAQIGPPGHHLAAWHYPNVVEPPRRHFSQNGLITIAGP